MKLTLTTIMIFALFGRAWGDELAASSVPPTVTMPPPPAGPLNRNLALALSAGGSAASVGLMLMPSQTVRFIGGVSLLVTPSLGEWYAGKFLTTGLVLRLTAVAAGVAYGALAEPCDEIEHCAGEVLAVGLPIVALYGTGIAWDIATARSTVDRRNESLHRLKLTPTVLPSPSGPVMGMGIGGSF